MPGRKPPNVTIIIDRRSFLSTSQVPEVAFQGVRESSSTLTCFFLFPSFSYDSFLGVTSNPVRTTSPVPFNDHVRKIPPSRTRHRIGPRNRRGGQEALRFKPQFQMERRHRGPNRALCRGLVSPTLSTRDPGTTNLTTSTPVTPPTSSDHGWRCAKPSSTPKPSVPSTASSSASP